MTVSTLPATVAAFVSVNNTHDVDALTALFADDAVVLDDGSTFTGRAEIAEFIRLQIAAPRIVLTPTGFEGDRLVASATGDFPGGPLEFAFVFVIRDDLITELSIGLA